MRNTLKEHIAKEKKILLTTYNNGDYKAMMIYTIGFTKKSAREFFELIRKNDINTMIDVRLNNKSQLAGFAKGTDLEYFLQEICDVKYCYEAQFAPTKELLDKWHKQTISWDEYTSTYNDILKSRRAEKVFEVRYKNAGNVCFLCAEPTPENCHRRLLAEYLAEQCPALVDRDIKHL